MSALRSMPLATAVLATLVLAAPGRADVTTPTAAESTSLPAETVAASAGAVPVTPAPVESTSPSAETGSASVAAAPPTPATVPTTATASATTATASTTTATASTTTATSGADAATSGSADAATSSADAATSSAEAATSSENAASTTPQPAPVASAVGSAALGSSATTQMIWQVQVAGCLTHCHAGSQLQIAVQQATLTQVIPIASGAAAPPSSGNATVASMPVKAPPIASGTTQVQLGCVRYCFGRTTLGASSPLSATTTQELVDGAGRAASSMAPSQSPGTPAAESSTSQVVGQWQSGSGATSAQSQIAVQMSTTIQVVAIASTLSALIGVESVASQVDEGIWQLQVGCMLDCADTYQEQVASQTDSSIRVSLAASASGVATTTLPTAATTAIIWQFQIGCISWCFDAVEVQVATGDPRGVTNGPASAGAPAATSGGNASVAAAAPVAAAAQVGPGTPTQFTAALGAMPPPALGAPAPIANVRGTLRSVERPPRLPALPDVADRSSSSAAVGGATVTSSSIEIRVVATVIRPSRRRFAHHRSSATSRRLIEPSRKDRQRAPDVAPRQPITVHRDDPGHLGWPIAAIVAVMLAAGLSWPRLFAVSRCRRRRGA